MAHDDWRLRIELDEEAAGGLLERLGLVRSGARNLEHELTHERFAVTLDGRKMFVYADSSLQLEKARAAIDAEAAQLGTVPDSIVTEHWLADEDRWDDEPAPETVEAETLAEGYAPWEVRIPCASHKEAHELAEQLEAEGYGVVRRWRFVIAGTSTREEAEELAEKLHGEAEPGGELVWEVSPGNPFAFFGGLGGDGTPV
jgi:hypothetical protein